MEVHEVLYQRVTVPIYFVNLKSSDHFVVVKRVDLILHRFNKRRLEVIYETVHVVKCHSFISRNRSSRRVLRESRAIGSR